MNSLPPTPWENWKSLLFFSLGISSSFGCSFGMSRKRGITGRWDHQSKLTGVYAIQSRRLKPSENHWRTSQTREHTAFLHLDLWTVSSTCISLRLKMSNFLSVSLNPNYCLQKTDQIVRMPDWNSLFHNALLTIRMMVGVF